MISIYPNSVIEWRHDDPVQAILERVLWIDHAKNVAVVIDLNKKQAVPVTRELTNLQTAISESFAIKRTVDPYARMYLREEDIPERNREVRDRTYNYISSIVNDEPAIYDPKLRGIMIRSVCEQFDIGKNDVYRYLTRYWQHGKTVNGLLPQYDKCGSPGNERAVVEGSKRGRKSRIALDDPEKTGVNIDDDIKTIFRIGINLYYNRKEKRPLRKCFQLIIENHFNVGYRDDNGVKVPVLPPAEELPTFGAFRYWYSKELDLKKKITAREGTRGFALRHRAVLGSSQQMAFGPGSIYQIDATIADVYLVNRYDRTQIIGRPVIYVVIDAFSRYITGLYVGLEGPSWLGAKMALANAFTDKVAYCSEYDISIEETDWNCPFLPEALLADRGELIGYNSDNIIEFLNIKVANTPPYRADWKGIVEQNFRLANLKTIHWLPGAIKERYRERGERDHRLDATLDLDQFTKIMIQTVLHHNNYHWMHWYSRDEYMIQEHLEPVPAELWRWGLENRSGHLREKPADLIALSLMPHAKATVTEFGIKFEGMHYVCHLAIKEQWFERARAYGSWKVPIAYDIRNKADTINLLLDDGRSYEVCHLLEKDARYRHYRLEEVRDLREKECLKTSQYESVKQQAGAELNAHIAAIVSEANTKTISHQHQSMKSDTQRVKNIRENRKVVREQIREEQQWRLEPLPEPQPIVAVVPEDVSIEPTLTKQQSFLKMLKGQRKETMNHG